MPYDSYCLTLFGTTANALAAFSSLCLAAPCFSWLYRRYARAVRASLDR